MRFRMGLTMPSDRAAEAGLGAARWTLRSRIVGIRWFEQTPAWVIAFLEQIRRR